MFGEAWGIVDVLLGCTLPVVWLADITRDMDRRIKFHKRGTSQAIS